ncbi:hypothetical protein E0L36_23470 [Streptomyces sp. AJS327]|uniref:hypothetical protein n=1 Tax=Streptomyces sp. AJS327 TaxID=2545265 RepID=UPI0015DF41C9|nr:hypothetical protein [Streptomyces sp. AJS327]MBA0053714.1 hypothetical protein [Streptomyces sp. AJS327]
MPRAQSWATEQTRPEPLPPSTNDGVMKTNSTTGYAPWGLAGDADNQPDDPQDGYRCPPELDRPILVVALTSVTALLTLALILAACQAPTPPPGGRIPTHCPSSPSPPTPTVPGTTSHMAATGG